MKTQKFLVEVTIHDTDKPLNADNVIGALDEGFDFPDWRIDAKEVK